MTGKLLGATEQIREALTLFKVASIVVFIYVVAIAPLTLLRGDNLDWKEATAAVIGMGLWALAVGTWVGIL